MSISFSKIQCFNSSYLIKSYIIDFNLQSIIMTEKFNNSKNVYYFYFNDFNVYISYEKDNYKNKKKTWKYINPFYIENITQYDLEYIISLFNIISGIKYGEYIEIYELLKKISNCITKYVILKNDLEEKDIINKNSKNKIIKLQKEYNNLSIKLLDIGYLKKISESNLEEEFIINEKLRIINKKNSEINKNLNNEIINLELQIYRLENFIIEIVNSFLLLSILCVFYNISYK